MIIRCINRQRFAEEMQILRDFQLMAARTGDLCRLPEHEFATMGDQLQKYLVPDDIDSYRWRLILHPARLVVGLCRNINEAIADPNWIALSSRLGQNCCGV